MNKEQRKFKQVIKKRRSHVARVKQNDDLRRSFKKFKWVEKK